MQKYKTIEQFINSLEPDKREIIELVRNIIFESKNQLEENIKWNAPNYSYKEIDRITFNVLNKENTVKLVLHFGANIKEDKKEKPIYTKHQNIISWASNIRGYISFRDTGFILQNKEILKEIIRDWLEINLT